MLRLRDERGFTLIELLVVVVVLGVLAAIAVPVYQGAQDNARDASVKTDLGNAKGAVVAYWADRGASAAKPTFDGAVGTGLRKYGYTRSADTTVSVAFPAGSSPTAESFCLEATGTTTHVFHTWQNGAIESGGC